MTKKNETTYNVTTYLSCAPTGTFTLEDGKKLEDIKEHYIKWDTFHYTFDGEDWFECELDSGVDDAVDWKRPSGSAIVEDTPLDDLDSIMNQQVFYFDY